MNIYILRHGTTVWNEKRITQGYFKNRLSEKGKREVEKSGESIKNVDIDIIYSSPLVRTMQSANIINKYHNVKIIKDKRIIGIDQGIFAGRYWDSLTKEEIELHNKRDPITKMESYESAYKRSLEFVNDVIINSKYKNIVIVTHSTNATCIEYILKNVIPDFNDNKSMSIYSNGEIKKIKLIK